MDVKLCAALLWCVVAASGCDLKQPIPSTPPHVRPTPALVKVDTPPAAVVLAPVGIDPKGSAQKQWLVTLHGYNSTPQDMRGLGDVAASMGWGAMAVPAIIENGPGRFAWPKDDLGRVDAYVQSVLSSQGLQGKAVHVAGFSQGAMYASLLAATYPERYLSALAFSPAGWASIPKTLQTSLKRPMCLTGGRKERARFQASLKALSELLDAHNYPVKVLMHDGGHHFPRDWKSYTKECLERSSSP